ncbi:MAG: hypothetical protein IKT94_04195 [Rikenellaceae bacterium]|nr:hypothetical protein [Rikenellaceae bacterium]
MREIRGGFGLLSEHFSGILGQKSKKMQKNAKKLLKNLVVKKNGLTFAPRKPNGGFI